MHGVGVLKETEQESSDKRNNLTTKIQQPLYILPHDLKSTYQAKKKVYGLKQTQHSLFSLFFHSFSHPLTYMNAHTQKLEELTF